MLLDLPSWKLVCKKVLIRLHGSDSTRDGGMFWTTQSEISLSRALARLYDPSRLHRDRSSSEMATTSSSMSPVAHRQDCKVDTILGSDGPLRSSIIYIIGNMSRVFMRGLNKTEVHGLEVMEAALRRPEGQPLITICNHVAAMDDPLVMSTVIPPAFYSRPENIRWTLCASDRCFKYSALVPLFRAAKVLPVQRGGGMRQPGMLAAEKKLQEGQWVHIFPEGTRSQGQGQMGAIRKGIGKLVAACEQTPLVVPFIHLGMDSVMPRGKILPSVGKEVRVLIGQPIPMEDLLSAARHQGWSEDKLHTAVAARVSRHLTALKTRLESGSTAPAGSAQNSLDGSSDEVLLGGRVSSLDHFDESDLRWEHQASMWEKAKFKMQHRAGRLGLPLMASSTPLGLNAPYASSSLAASSPPPSNGRETGSFLSLMKQIPLLSARLFHSGVGWEPQTAPIWDGIPPSPWGLRLNGSPSTSNYHTSTSQPALFDCHRTEGLMNILSL